MSKYCKQNQLSDLTFSSFDTSFMLNYISTGSSFSNETPKVIGADPDKVEYWEEFVREANHYFTNYGVRIKLDSGLSIPYCDTSNGGGIYHDKEEHRCNFDPFCIKIYARSKNYKACLKKSHMVNIFEQIFEDSRMIDGEKVMNFILMYLEDEDDETK